VGNELVEFFVLFWGDFVSRLEPESSNSVDDASIDLDRESDKIGVFLDNILDCEFFGELTGVFTELDIDFGSTLNAISFLDGIGARTTKGEREKG